MENLQNPEIQQQLEVIQTILKQMAGNKGAS